MYKCIIVLCIAIVFLSITSCRNDGIPEITVTENTEADFGTIAEKDGPKKVLLLLPNTYGDTLRPATVMTRCACIIADVDKTPVAPDETLKVAVTYDPSYKSGIFMEEVGIKCIGRDGILSLIVKGEVKPMRHNVSEDHPYSFGKNLHLSHETLHFGKLRPGERGSMFVRCANSGKKDMTLTFGIPEEFRDDVSLVRVHTVSGNGKDTVWIHFTMPEHVIQGDTLTFPITPEVNGQPADKKLNVKAIYRQ